MKYTDVFIVGAPKCGTTSLFDWLAAHPEVCGASTKETCYFLDQGNPFLKLSSGEPIENYHENGIDRYRSFFSHALDEQKICCEATPLYMYESTPLQYFSQREDKPYVIFVLRNPSKRIYSHFNFSQNKLNAISKQISFSHFVDLILQDNLDDIASHVRHDRAMYWLKNQLLFSRYYEHIANWMESYDKDKIMFFLFEEMIKDPNRVLKEIAVKIGIDESFFDTLDCTISNETYQMRFKFMKYFLKPRTNTPHGKGGKLSFLKILQEEDLSKSSGISQLLFKRSTKGKFVKSQEDIDAIQRLDEYFAPHNQKLFKSLELNWSCW